MFFCKSAQLSPWRKNTDGKLLRSGYWGECPKVGIGKLYRQKQNNLYTSTNRLTNMVIISRRMKSEWKVKHMWRKKPDSDTHLLTDSMVQNPSWEANWFAASQEIPRIFMETEGSLPHSQASAICPCPGPAQSSPHTHIPPPGDPS